MAADVERDDAATEGAHGTDDRRCLVDGVRDDVSMRAKPPPDEPVAFIEEPGGLSNGADGADEQVLDDQVELTPLAAEVLQRVPYHQLDTEPVEAEVTAGDADDLAVQLDTHDLGVGIQGPERPADAAGGQAQQKDASGAASGQEENGGGEGPPDDAGERATRAVNRGLCAVDPQLEAAADAPDLDPWAGRAGPGHLRRSRTTAPPPGARSKLSEPGVWTATSRRR
jgi:hypothetical protein